MNDSPLTRANRPLPHEFEDFLKVLDEQVIYIREDKDVSYDRVFNWLKELSK